MEFEEKLKVYGQRIKSIRLAQNLTQTELAKKANVSISYLSRIENGKCNYRVHIIMNIIKALGCGFEIFD